MKPTFKQFLEDITVDDDAYHPNQSDSVTKGAGVVGMRLKNTKWKDVPLKEPFPVKGFSVKYNQQKTRGTATDRKTFDIALIDDKTGQIAVHIDCTSKKYSVPGGTIQGLETEQLSSHEDYRGKGLVVALYKCLAENGQNLFSSILQTTGGASVWKRLVNTVKAEVYVVIPSHEVEPNGLKTPRGLDLEDFDYVLVKGSEEQLNRVAYDIGSDTFWFVTPDATPAMKKYMVSL